MYVIPNAKELRDAVTFSCGPLRGREPERSGMDEQNSEEDETPESSGRSGSKGEEGEEFVK